MTPRKSGSGLIPETVTVDRIDQTKGYVIDNIRLICFAANNARYVWGDEQLLKLANALVGTGPQLDHVIDLDRPR